MKKNKNLFVCLMLAGILLVSVLIGTVAARRQETPASKELTVVTSFYPMYIAAENVIGDVYHQWRRNRIVYERCGGSLSGSYDH